MSRQTVSATPEGLARAQNALTRLFGTQLSLAKTLTGLVGRNTIQNFFQRKGIRVDKFQAICQALTLEPQWEAIAGLSIDSQDFQPLEPAKDAQDISIDVLVQDVRYAKR